MAKQRLSHQLVYNICIYVFRYVEDQCRVLLTQRDDSPTGEVIMSGGPWPYA